MDLLRRFWGDDARIAWGYKFKWTSNHLTEDQLSHLLYSYDKLADDALDRIDKISPPKSKSWKCEHGSGEGQRDIYALLKEHADSDEVLGQLWREVSTIPEWVDWDQIHRGQRLVYQFSGQVLLGLCFMSLLGGMGSWRVVETLSRTGGFGVNVTRRRLLETLQHFMEVTEDLDAIKPGGKGFESSVRVRLLHAAVRRRLMHLEHEKPGYFDMEKLGVPINDAHTISTIAVYSSAIIYLALPQQGIFFTKQQTADYLALWRYVGHLLGAPTDWMATPEQAKAMTESLAVAEIQPSENSKILANNILTAESRVPPLYAPREYLAAEAYRLNGYALASSLGIDEPGLYYRSLVWLRCVMLVVISYAYPWLPLHVRQRRDRRFRNFAHQMITSQKLGGIGQLTKYEFQYIPQLGMMTELGSPEEPESVYASSKPRKSNRSLFWAVLVVGAAVGSAAVVKYMDLGVGLDAGVLSWLRSVPRYVLVTAMTQAQVLQSFAS